ncbi:putative 4-hydroxybenzoate polyprenyl transferase [Annulohypoxylon bovei var. microspora]|nr:putative 4-hydroxybenzoate polyprenyl transferase [Annulohypoxylon bovei var. microspora]
MSTSKARFFGCIEDKDINFFPSLPPYSDPTTGVVSVLPRPWIPYAQLMRLDRPAGFYAFYFPYLIGLAYAACVAPEPPEPLTLLKLAAILLPFNILLRGAACTWNDTVDQHFDRRVARTRHRPLARGAVSTTQANLFTLAQILALYLFHGLDLLPPCTTSYTAIAVGLFGIYALMKRVMHYPQVVLGVALAFPAAAALGTDPLSGPTLALFGANLLWTVTYDTIYAHQDVADDAKAGVKSMALRFRDSTKTLAGVLSVAQVGLLALCGVWADFGLVYFVSTVCGVAAAMAYYIYDVDLMRPESCGVWFHRQFWVVGAAFVAGFVGEYLLRLGYP